MQGPSDRQLPNSTPPTPEATFLDLIRAFATMSGPAALLSLFMAGGTACTVAGSVAGWPRGWARCVLRPLAAAGAVTAATYLTLARPWMMRWGASEEELRKPLPGDELVPDPGMQSTRAVTIHAPVEQVWPWLAQIGQDRAGFYSYEWLENIAGCRMRNADALRAEWQQRQVGQTVLLHWASGLRLRRFEPNRLFAMEGGWYFALEPIDRNTTRLYARSRAPKGWSSLLYELFMVVPHFVMERKMLLGIKQRAERAAGGRTLLDDALPLFDFRGQTASTVIHASPERTFQALREVTLADMPVANALGTLRYLLGLLTGRIKRRPDDMTRPFFEVSGNLVLAEEPNREIVVGSIGRLHNLLDQQFVPLDGPEAFARFATPGYEKLAMSFRIADGDGARGYRLVCEHRTRALGADARWKFGLYWWLLIKWGSAVMLWLLFDAVKRRAERLARGAVVATRPATGRSARDVGTGR